MYLTSDQRRKKEIRDTKRGLSTLMQLNVRDYKWVEDKRNQNSTTGFIAQELYEVYPNAVRKGGADPQVDPWQIAPTELIPLIVKSTQDQQKEIEALKKENQELKKRMQKMEKILGI